MRPAAPLLAGAALALGAGAAGATVPFPRADANRDGLVTYAEAKRVMPLLPQVHFERCDPDGSGSIDQAEYPLLDNFYWMIYVDP